MDKDDDLITYDRITRLEQALEAVYNWSRAYPPSQLPPPNYEGTARILVETGLLIDPMGVTPHPDYDKANRVLAHVGPMLDLIREDCMRQSIYAIGELAHEALKVEDKLGPCPDCGEPLEPRNNDEGGVCWPCQAGDAESRAEGGGR